MEACLAMIVSLRFSERQVHDARLVPQGHHTGTRDLTPLDILRAYQQIPPPQRKGRETPSPWVIRQLVTFERASLRVSS